MVIVIKIFIFMISFISAQISNEKLYVSIQMMDQVGIIDTENYQYDFAIEIEMQNNNVFNCIEIEDEMSCAMLDDCEWMMGMCMENMDSEDINTPHFIVMDENLGYWFVTTIASGYVAQYSLVDNTFIDAYFVGDAPAILTIDTNQQKIYCSRMMPMNGMGDMMPNGESNIIQALHYSHLGLSLAGISEYEINSPAPHGLAISSDGSKIYTASNTADWLYKINVESGNIESVIMDSNIGNPPDQTTQRLKPIQCLVIDNKLFVTCSAGPWYNPFTGETTIIPGMLQLWNNETMTLLSSISIGDFTSPWHIKESPIDNLVYISLAGDNLYDSGGVACIRYTAENDLQLEWMTTGPTYSTPHGVDVSKDGERIYISDRGNGNVYQFNAEGQNINTLFIGSMSMLGGISLTKSSFPDLGDVNYDQIINVIDIIIIVNHIVNELILDPYSEYASDLNLDENINISDIIELINIIIN